MTAFSTVCHLNKIDHQSNEFVFIHYFIMSQLIVQLRHAKRNQATSLELTNRLLTFLPKEIYSLLTLTFLNLSHNKIAHIEPTISQLSQLQCLLLNSNEITDLPIQILQLQQLTTLQIRDNPLSDQFQPLLALRSHDLLTDVLHSCFRMPGNAMTHTPSWLTESHSKNIFKIEPLQRDIKYESMSSKRHQPQRRISLKPKTMSKNESQPQKQYVMGTLILKPSQITLQKQYLRTDSKVLSSGMYCGLPVTIKKPAINERQQRIVPQFQNQITILSKYRHPFIVLLVGAIPVHSWIVTEQLQCPILDSIKHGISEEERSKIVHKLLLAISYLHSHGILHRNICAENVFMDSLNHPKLTNFAGSIHQSQQIYHKPYSSHLPSLYSAPELQHAAESIQSEMFAVGTLLYQIYFGELPRSGNELQLLLSKYATDGQLPYRLGVKKQIWQLINRCRSPEGRERPNCSFLLKFREW